MKDCPNCVFVKNALLKLSKNKSFATVGSNTTLKCKQGHLVYED